MVNSFSYSFINEYGFLDIYIICKNVKFANENNFNLERYKIDWENKGKSAGIWANKAIVYGKDINEQRPTDILIVFTTNNMKEDKLLEHLLEEISCCVTHVNELKEPEIYIF